MVTIILTFFFNFYYEGSKVNKVDFHDFHLSRCDVNFDTKNGELQVAAHIFIDDLENALTKMGRSNLYLCTTKENTTTNDAIEQYLNKNLIFKIQNSKYKLSLIGKETSKDLMAVWCYLEITGLQNLSSIYFENTILTELFNDQKNIVDFTIDKKKKHFTIFDSKKIKDYYEW